MKEEVCNHAKNAGIITNENKNESEKLIVLRRETI
jgi:hypothetical protein